MIKQPTNSDIASLRFLVNNFATDEKKITMLTLQCKKFKLTTDFVKEFKEYITKDSFSSSPGLTSEVIKSFPELFDTKVWREAEDKSLDLLMDDEFVETLEDDDIDVIIQSTNPKIITSDIFEKYYDNITDETKKFIVNKTSLANSEEFIKKHSKHLTEDIFINTKVHIAWTNDLIENIAINKTLTVKFLTAMLAKSYDIAFIDRILTTGLNFSDGGGTADTEIKIMINKLPEDYMESLFNMIFMNNRNALSYDVLTHVLKMKDDLSEQFLLDYVQCFKEVGMEGSVAEYARPRNYEAVLLNLHMM